MAADDDEESAKDREEKVTDLKEQIERGEYSVDPTSVADAIVRRVRELADARIRALAERVEPADPWTAPPATQNECSYPDSSPGASVNTTPVSPSTTDPIQVKPTALRRLAQALSTPPLAGTQTQSS